MKPSLDGVREKIKRAKKHVDELELLVEEFKRDNSKRVAFKYDPEIGKHVAQVEVPSPPPLAWSVIIGDIMHNLRSALEHLAWQLELAAGRIPDRGTEFPIYWDATKFQDAVKRGVPNRFPNDAWRVIEQLQPCRNGDRYPFHALYRLHELNRRDKHQLLTLTSTFLPFPTLTATEEHPDGTVSVIADSVAVPEIGRAHV